MEATEMAQATQKRIRKLMSNEINRLRNEAYDTKYNDADTRVAYMEDALTVCRQLEYVSDFRPCEWYERGNPTTAHAYGCSADCNGERVALIVTDITCWLERRDCAGKPVIQALVDAGVWDA